MKGIGKLEWKKCVGESGEMRNGEAKRLLGFGGECRPSPGEVKAAYKKKVWEFHPDRFPVDEKLYAESQFKLISQAYYSLLHGGGGGGGCDKTSVSNTRVVRTGMPRVYGGGGGRSARASLPFVFIVVGTFGLGALNITRAYTKQKDINPSHNPFLP